ncbi:aldo/keto reductase, partial
LQSEYSLWTRDVEATILPTCRELNIAFVAYAPLGRGFLTGAIQKANDLSPNDWRHTFPRFQEEILDKNRSIVDTISAIAAQHKA